MKRFSLGRRKSAPDAATRRGAADDDDAQSVSTLESGVSHDSRVRLNNAPRSDAPMDAPPGTRRRRGGPGSVAGSVASEVSEVSAGPEKWRRVRRGAHLSYVPFDVEDYQEAAEVNLKDQTFPPLSETSDDTKNWPKPCPFLHVKFKEFTIADKRSFIATAYYFWYFLTLTFMWSLMSAIVTNLISPTPQPETVWITFIIGFVGFWWFFFGYFRLLYHSMRYRKGVLYTLFQLETVVLFFIACYQMFTAVGNLTKLLSPLAPGSAVPVRQNPMLAAIFLAVGAFMWLVVLFYCFYFVRRSHYFKNLPLAVEKEIWLKEQMPGYLELKKKNLSEYILDKFREKPDPPHVPVRCGLLQGKDLWLQGQLLLETVYLEFKADVYVFDHLCWERVHYQDVLDVRKYGKTGLLFQVLNPSRRATEDVEIIVDFGDSQLRANVYKTGRRLWRRVGRNMDLLAKLRVQQLRKLKRAGQRARIDLEDPDPVEAFSKARRLETRERLADHLVTYRDWQKMLAGIRIHVLSEGETLLATGDEFTRLFHVAQGRIEVSEVVDTGASSVASGSQSRTALSPREMEEMNNGSKAGEGNREAQTWAKYTAGRDGRLEEKGDEPEYEDPETDHHPTGPPRRRDLEEGYGSGGSDDESESRRSSSDDEEGGNRNRNGRGGGGVGPAPGTASEYTSQYSSDVYSMSVVSAQGPETVLLGTLRKDDIFGVVPFLLSKEGQAPRSGLTFTARDPITVMFSIDCEFLRTDILKPKKDVTSAFYKYLAVILGERTEAAEDAMFTRKVREKRLESARAEEALLAKRRQREEELGFSDKVPQDKDGDRAMTVRQLFNFSASEAVLGEYLGKYTYRDATLGKIIKVSGSFFITTHYFAFAGRKVVDVDHMELNRTFKDLMRHDEVITVRFEGKKGLLFTDQRLDKKMFEVKNAPERDELHLAVMARWKSEDEVTSKEMRKLLRRKMTRLSLGYLTQAERLTQQTIGRLMADMTEKDKKQLFAGSVPIGLNRNQVVIGEYNFNDNLYLLCTGIVRVQRVQEHAQNSLDSGKAMDRVVFQEIHSGEIFGFDSFLTGAPAYSSIVVESEKAVVRSCTKDQIMARLREDRRLAATFYRIAAVSIASRLAEISPLDIYL